MPATSREAPRRGPRPNRLWLWGPVALYCALIFGLSSIPDVPSLPGGLSDKTGHALLYAGLGFLVARALAVAGTGRLALRAAIGGILAATLYGFSDEVHQLFVPNRQFDLLDLSADLVGASLGTAARWLWVIIRS